MRGLRRRTLPAVKVERKADHAVSEGCCKEASGRTLADWFEALDKHGGIALGRRELDHWLQEKHGVDGWWSNTVVNEYEIARGDLAKDGRPKGYSICPTKSIRASPQQCYEAFASAQALDAWFGPRHELDLRDGGHWRNADGHRAAIRKVNAGKNIRLIAEDDGLTLPTPVEIKFTPSGAKCTVMISIDRLQTRAEADGYRRLGRGAGEAEGEGRRKLSVRTGFVDAAIAASLPCLLFRNPNNYPSALR